MASAFGAELGRSFEEARKRTEPTGFWGSIAEGFVGGLAKGAGEIASERLIGGTLTAYDQAQKDKADTFLATESIAEARRNNVVSNAFITEYKEALANAAASGTSETDALANMTYFTAPALAEFKKLGFVKEGRAEAFSDSEILQMTADKRREEVKRQRTKLDEIYNAAKGIRSKDQFEAFLRREAPRTRGLLLNIKDRLSSTFKGTSMGELAEQRILTDERYQKSLGALEALETYRTDRNEGKFITSLREIKLGDIEKQYYMTDVKTTTAWQKHNKGYARFKVSEGTNQISRMRP